MRLVTLRVHLLLSLLLLSFQLLSSSWAVSKICEACSWGWGWGWQAYELVPETYRQKFRVARKQESDTYVAFANELSMLFG